MSAVFSTKKELVEIADYLTAYMKIPFFQDDSIPGKIMEKIISLVRNGEQLTTYDYVDVCIRNDVGWSVKSTKENTPLTWKRAKIPNSAKLISESENDAAKCQKLGDSIIAFCNGHISQSLAQYSLKSIGYSRLILLNNNTAVYFERELCDKANPNVFKASDYTWKWSKSKNTKGKEQLSALHGTNIATGKKAFAWHGKGENQLHFNGEKDWWPDFPEKITSKSTKPVFSSDNHAISFSLPDEKVGWGKLVAFLKVAS
jgi:hypothetical protein